MSIYLRALAIETIWEHWRKQMREERLFANDNTDRLRSSVVRDAVDLNLLRSAGRELPRTEPLEPEERPVVYNCQDCRSELVPYDDGRGWYCPNCGTD